MQESTVHELQTGSETLTLLLPENQTQKQTQIPKPNLNPLTIT